MDLMNMLMSGGASKAIEALTNVGFSADMAEKFLPEAGKQLAAASGEAGGTDIDKILGAIDLSALSSATNIPVDMVQKGLKALLPVIVDKLNLGSAASLLSSAKSLF